MLNVQILDLVKSNKHTFEKPKTNKSKQLIFYIFFDNQIMHFIRIAFIFFVNLVTLLREIILQTAYNNLIEITSAKKIEKYLIIFFGKSMSVFLHLGNFYVKSLISTRCKFNISDRGTEIQQFHGIFATKIFFKPNKLNIFSVKSNSVL